MYDRPLEYAALADLGQAPQVFLRITTQAGHRLYGKQTPTESQTGFVETLLADGSWKADGSQRAGGDSVPILCRLRGVSSFGSLSEGLSQQPGMPISMLQGGRVVEALITLANMPDTGGCGPGNLHWSRLAGVDSPVEAVAELSMTFPGLTPRQSMRRFSGRIKRIEFSRNTVTVRILGA